MAPDSLADFYTGKTVFMTGGAGILGTFLLEVLLRCFPGIHCIYILLRSKKGVDPLDRKEKIFQKKAIRKIAENSPELVEKVQVIAGDVSMANLGMSDDDLKRVCEEVTIVFHGAASINFKQPYRPICLQNAQGTIHMAEVCRKIKKLDVFVYTSTAYANIHVYPEKIEEKIYALPHLERTLDEMVNGSNDSFAKLISSMPFKWPNSYAFSKCLTENILNEKFSDLPIAVVRPSIVMCPWKGPCRGLFEAGNGLFDLSTAVGKGFVKVIHGDKDCIFDLIPADIVSNVHAVAAWSIATGRRPNMFIVNCTGGDTMKLKFGTYIDEMYVTTKRYSPIPKCFQDMSVTIVKSKFLYTILTIYQHYIPAVVMDTYLRLIGNKLRLVKLYKFFDHMMEHLHPFLSRSINFTNDNFYGLSKQLEPAEKEMIYTDIGASFYEMIQAMPSISDAFDWNTDRMSPKKRKHLVFQRTMILTAVKRFTLFLIIYFIYYITSKLFF